VTEDPDVVVIGSGPNGLVAACTLAREGLRVLVLEADDTIGGGARTAELTRPGFRHDLCSAFHPLAQVGPIAELPPAEHGLAWCHSPRPYGGATPDGAGVALGRTPEESAALFERAAAGDGDGWRELLGWWEWGGPTFLSLLHSDLSPDDARGAAFGLMLHGLAQQVGMSIPRGGVGTIIAASGPPSYPASKLRFTPSLTRSAGLGPWSAHGRRPSQPSEGVNGARWPRG
jgi:phytoene dehydrogenase-like protein